MLHNTLNKQIADNNCNCSELYPQYGAAPHECYWRKEGGFDKNKLGTSTIEPLNNWPDNFLAEIDPDESIKEQLSWGLCGVWFCPVCKAEMEKHEKSEGLYSKEKIIAAIENR